MGLLEPVLVYSVENRFFKCQGSWSFIKLTKLKFYMLHNTASDRSMTLKRAGWRSLPRGCALSAVVIRQRDSCGSAGSEARVLGD